MKADLEHDLFSSEYIRNKCKNSEIYSQNLYASFCNNRFFKNNEEWSCSWRMAGGIVADLRDKGEEYIDWYCSGILGTDSIDGYVSESVVTPEITNDLLDLGWIVKPYEPNWLKEEYSNEQ